MMTARRPWELAREIAGAIQRRRAHLLVAAGAIAYAVVLGVFSLRAHDGLRTQMDDLGNMAQALWGASRGDLLMPESNDVDGVVRSRLAIHTNFIFWLFAPAYRLFGDPRLLLVLTTLACALAGVGIYLFARRRLGDDRLALLPAFAFWLSPLVHDANLYDFHVVTVVAALVVWMIWAFDGGRTRLAWTLFGLALLCQEHVALLTFFYGLYLALSGPKRTGVVIMFISAAFALLVLVGLVPLLNDGQTISKISGPDNRFRWVLADPSAVLSKSTQPERLRMILFFLLCGAGACLGQWRFLLLLLPAVLTALLNGGYWMSRLTGTYYWVTEAAIIHLASVLAASPWRPGKAATRGPLVYVAAASAITSLLLSPLPHSLVSSLQNHEPSTLSSALATVMRDVPPQAALAVQNNLGPHLAHRSSIATFPRRLKQAEYAAFYLRHVGGPDVGLFVRPSCRFLTGMAPEPLVLAVQNLLQAPDWSLISQSEGFYLFRRGPGHEASTQALETFQRDAQMFFEQCDAAAEHRLAWARLLSGPFRWNDLKPR